MAKADHPDQEFVTRQEHLDRFVEDLKKIPPPDINSPAIQNFSQQVLPNLHRPFPSNYKKAIAKNSSVFQDVIGVIGPFNMQLKFGDPQSGIILQQKGDKIFLKWNIVVDHDREKGLSAEQNGRIYLEDMLEIDAQSQKVLKLTRNFASTPELPDNLVPVFVQLSRTDPPAADSPEIQDLARSMLIGMGVWEENSSPPSKPKLPDLDLEKLRGEARTPFEKNLLDLFELTTSASVMEVPIVQPVPFATVPGLPQSEVDRDALHQALGLLLRKVDNAAVGIRKLKENALQLPSTNTLLETLALLSEGKTDQAQANLDAIPRAGMLRRKFDKLVSQKNQEGIQAQGLPLLKLAAAEILERKISEDKAWLMPSEGFSNAGELRQALESFFATAESLPPNVSPSLKSRMIAAKAEGPDEQKIQDLLLSDPTLMKLMSIYEDPQAETRRESLKLLAFTDLTGLKPLPTTALAALQIFGSESEDTKDLRSWLSGNASFAQKFEHLLPVIGNEIASPPVIASMILAGGLSSVGKLAFFSRFGYQTRALRLGAELSGLALEAPSFVFSEKLLQSAFRSPDQQWDHVGRDLLGAAFAFASLRGMGKFSRYLGDKIEAGPLKATIEAGEWRSAWAEGLLKNRPSLPLSFASKPVLEKLGQKGITADWIVGMSRGLLTHGTGLTGLMLVNSLARALDLREASKQGLKANLIDDMLMYANFTLSGHLAQRLAPGFGLGKEQILLDALENPRKKPDVAQEVQTTLLLTEGPTAPEKPATRWQNFRKSWSEGWKNLRGRVQKKFETEGKDPVDDIMGHFPPKIAKPLESWLRRLLARLGIQKIERPSLSGTAPAQGSGSEIKNIENGAANENASVEKVESEKPTAPALPKVRPLPEKPEAFLELPILPLRPDNNPKQEWTLGRETPQSVMTETLVEIPFASNIPDLASRHAKISRIKSPKSTPKREIYEYYLEALKGETLLNGKVLKGKPVLLSHGAKIRLGKEGPTLTFNVDKINLLGYLVPEPIVLNPKQVDWVLGRDNSGGQRADVLFPASERQISRRHAKIVRSDDGNYFVQDYSNEGTFLNDAKVYGTQPISNKDTIDLGRGMKLIFHLQRKEVAHRTETSAPGHERGATPPPQQAEVHPSFRDLSPESVPVYLQMRREIERINSSLGEEESTLIKVAELRLPEGGPLTLEADATGWILGAHPEAKAPNVQAIPLQAAPGVAVEHAKLFLDASGRFILQALDPSAPVFIQGRSYREVTKMDGNGRPISFREWEIHPTAVKQAIEGWTVLQGTERIFLGNDYYIDFWPGYVATPPKDSLGTTEGLPSSKIPGLTEPSNDSSFSGLQAPVWKTMVMEGEPAAPFLMLPPGIKVRMVPERGLSNIQIDVAGESGSFLLKYPASQEISQRAEITSENGGFTFRVLGSGNYFTIDSKVPSGQEAFPLKHLSKIQVGGLEFRVYLLTGAASGKK